MARSLATPKASPQSLAKTLAGFDDERLVALLAARPDLADPPPDDVGALARRAEGWPSVLACYRGLDRWCQQVVQVLCLLPAPTSVADLAALLGPDAEAADVQAALALLADRALLARRDDALELVPAFAQLSYPAGLGPPLATALATKNSIQLTEMARRLHVKPAGTKMVTLAALAAALADVGVVQDVIDAGPERTSLLVADVIEHGPVVLVPGGFYGPSLSDATPVGWLVNRGLLVPTSWNEAVMPAEAGLAVRGGRPFAQLANRRPDLAHSAVGTDAVDTTAAQAGLRVVTDVIAILDAWATDPPALLKAGGLGIREIRRAAKATGRTEVEIARIIDLAAVAGLAEIDSASGTALPSAGYDDWLPLEPADRWATLASAWWVSPYHLGLAGVIGTNNKPIPPLIDRLLEPEAAGRRRAVLDVLGGMEPGTSADATRLPTRVEWDAPLLWEGGPAWPRMLIDWVVEEAELVGLCSQGALATPGRLLAAGRLDAAVAALATHAPPVSSSFVVQADLTVVAPGELAAPVRAELELVADVESKGSATVYRLSEASLRRGFEAGRTAGDIGAFVAEHATRDVPQSLSYLIADLGRRFGQVRVGAAPCYVRSDEPSLLAEVTRSRRTARLGLRLLAPTVAVANAELTTVLDVLRGAGYLPAPEGVDGALVLTRPVTRRAAPRLNAPTGRFDPACRGGRNSAWGGSNETIPGCVDLAAVVDRLRKAPPSSPEGPMRSVTEPCPQPAIFGEVESRPLEIAKDAADIELLLARAFVEDWAVRVAYTNNRGRSSQLNVVVLDAPGDDVLVQCLPAYNSRTLVLDRIEWARVMTDAEEEMLL